MVPHAIIVDFAIALLVVSVGFDMLAAIVEERELRVVSWWTLLLGTMAAALSAVSGYATASTLSVAGEVSDTLELHRYLGLATLTSFAICSVWRARQPGSFPERYTGLYWTLASIGLGSLLVTAYFGGILVFRFAVGVVPPA